MAIKKVDLDPRDEYPGYSLDWERHEWVDPSRAGPSKMLDY